MGSKKKSTCTQSIIVHQELLSSVVSDTECTAFRRHTFLFEHSFQLHLATVQCYPFQHIYKAFQQTFVAATMSQRRKGINMRVVSIQGWNIFREVRAVRFRAGHPSLNDHKIVRKSCGNEDKVQCWGHDKRELGQKQTQDKSDIA